MKTIAKTVSGLVSDGNTIAPAAITVRFTSSENGETLSLSYNEEFMLMVDYRKIKEIIEEARKNKNDKL